MNLGTSNSLLDQTLQECDVALQTLKEHLRIAQDSMKKFADRKPCEVEWAVGDWVFWKIRSYRQTSLAKRKNEKLSPKYFGPYQVVTKVGTLACRLALSYGTPIHHVFHVPQLKELVGPHRSVQSSLHSLLMRLNGLRSPNPCVVIDRILTLKLGKYWCSGRAYHFMKQLGKG